MKKLIYSLCILFIITFFLSGKILAQNPPRDAGGAAGGPVPVSLIIDFGSAGEITIPTTSSYYSCIVSALTRLNVTIANGVVTFPTSSCYRSSLLVLYYTGYINYNGYNTCKSKYSVSKQGYGDD